MGDDAPLTVHIADEAGNVQPGRVPHPTPHVTHGDDPGPQFMKEACRPASDVPETLERDRRPVQIQSPCSRGKFSHQRHATPRRRLPAE